MTDQPAEPPQMLPIEIFVPDDLQTGVYANGMGTWFSATEFTLDFGVALPSEVVATDDGQTAIRNQARLVARVKIPPTQVFEIIRNINSSLTEYEDLFGPISGPHGSPDEPLFPPTGDPDDPIG